MKMRGMHAVVVVVWLVLMAAPFLGAYAAGMYVRDWITITVRTEPNESAKIISVAKSNDYLEVIKEGEEWTRVKAPDGREGWVMSRYLTNQMPKTLMADRLKDQVKSLTEQVAQLKKENDRLLKENKSLSSSEELQAMRLEYERLQRESGEYAEMKKRNDELEARYAADASEIERLTRENNRMKTSERLIFTLIGGGFIGVGLVIGMVLQIFRGRPKKAGYRF
ncbi:MAG: TIGR04211 family SH3 domain-containing protein [Desulfomonilia bacterium]|jgi:SH3 domain protein|uniref:SH3 domain-containing protein n=1 Tax=anaerobic digester metagenome TaxID=1263854 RepID=A0A485M400_9ZZZZ|nr:TIGR04211 family SH3 domain-containing protein [Pseudomonadota bacterium]HON39037.1 TIGR04211 family SH3 domain-containing protein [Deltaproteobacteria bacterium]HPD21608.1 TIGR04211 family SH3 domain-containing protein [Deltaproteobacteria bacterium]HRS56567.1 TIGR04211 family SH3 domain-containing protein [Desulfomonilia bacterium]HRV36228.1 TIGR04211 family SH3 domain-containing protein [Desulfomonilia bacterium]